MEFRPPKPESINELRQILSAFLGGAFEDFQDLNRRTLVLEGGGAQGSFVARLVDVVAVE